MAGLPRTTGPAEEPDAIGDGDAIDDATPTPAPEPDGDEADEADPAESDDDSTPVSDDESTPEPTPTATPVEEPDPQSYSGSGQTVESGVEIEGGFTVFEMDHDGDSNFQIELIDEDSGDSEELLANEIGEWEGIYAIYVPPGEYTLDINADGNWNVDVLQPRHTADDVEQMPVQGTDAYPDYIGPVEFDGLATFTAQYEGDSNFAVWVLDAEGERVDLVFNEVGEFEGEATFSGDGHGYILVEATGDWRLEVE